MPPVNRETAIATLVMAVLTLCALPICVWFAVHSTMFVAEVQYEIEKETPPGAVTFSHIEWGPALGQATAYDVTITHRTGAPILQAARVHITLDTDRFSNERSKTFKKLSLVVTKIVVEDFELTLAWDRFGDLGLAEMFREKVVGIATKAPRARDTLIDLQDIELKNGTLHLVWPSFGFTFTRIDTAGSVQVMGKKDAAGKREGDLNIDVAALDSLEGTVWIREPPKALHQQLTSLMPRNPVAETAPAGLRIPFHAVRIRNYTWRKQGFSGDLEIDATGDVPIKAHIGLAFGEDEPTTHDIRLEVGLPASFTETLSAGAAAGATTVRLETSGKDLVGRFGVGPTRLQRLVLGDVVLENLALEELTIDAQGQEGRIAVRASAARVQARKTALERVDLDVELFIGHDGWNLETFLEKVISPPESLLGYMRMFPLSTRAGLTIKKLAVGAFRRGPIALKDIAIHDVMVTVELPDKAVGHLGKIGIGASSLSGDVVVERKGMLGIELDTKAKVTFKRLPRVLAALIPQPKATKTESAEPDAPGVQPPVLGDGPFDGTLTITGNLLKQSSLKLKRELRPTP